MRARIADHLLRRLVEAGVRHVFGVPGDFNLRLLDVIEAHPALEWVGNANELNAAYAADGYARMRGLAAVVTTYGVGELSALNGIAGSFAESVPVLMVAGTPTTAVQGSGLPIHHSLLDGDFRRFVRAYESVTVASSVLSASNASAEIDRVMARMLAEKRPGYLSFPADLVEVVAPPLPSPVPAVDAAGAEDAFVERARALLAGASSVVVLADHLVQRYGVRSQLDALIRAGSLPAATISGAKATIDETTPGFLGLYIGALSEPGVREAVEGADVVIGAGLRLADVSSGGFTARLDPSRLIDVQPRHVVVAGEPFQRVSMAAALRGLTAIVAGRAAPPPSFVERDGHAPSAADAPLTQAAFWCRAGTFLRKGDIVAADQGTPFYGTLGLRLPAGVDFVAQPLWASIGYTLPALLGAQLGAAPGRRGVLFIGDGAAQMTAQELGTLLRRRLPTVVFLLNNDGYTVERAINGPAATYNDIARWDWQHIPRAFGARASAPVLRAATTGELETALAACDAAGDELAFVEVVLDRHDTPPVLSRLAGLLAEQNN